jgi:predicted P-loop ATPase/GTPase
MEETKEQRDNKREFSGAYYDNYKALIVGLREKDAGKTSFALALLAYLREEGLNASGFKPRAGNSVWYDYDVVHEALTQGRLYGKDAKLLSSASAYSSVSTTQIEEFINPIHRLWAEPSRINPSSQIPCFILDRVTLWYKAGVKNMVVENEALSADYNNADFRDIRANASTIYQVRDLKTLNTITERYYSYAVELAYKKMLAQHEYVVIESYSDIALPWNGLNDLDIVIGVKPGQMLVYEPKKYLAAVQLVTPPYSQEEIRTARIVELIKPLKVVNVPPFRSEQLLQALTEKIPLLLESKSIR